MGRATDGPAESESIKTIVPPAGIGVTRRSAPKDTRRRQLRRLAGEHFDVLVIGGGVTGCGVALDAASRGLSVALVEKRDFAAGTSSRSSKLIHGGLRYLEQLDIGLVREALHERRLLVETLAPHLVHPTPFLFPLAHGLRDRARHGRGPPPVRRARGHASRRCLATAISRAARVSVPCRPFATTP